MISFKRLEFDQVPWEKLDQFKDRTVFQTRPWLQFVMETQEAEPIVAEVIENRSYLGYFTGLIVKKLGIRILGSPFKGWTTAYMGFNLIPSIPRSKVLAPLAAFVFNDLKCHFLEIMDRNTTESDQQGLAFDMTYFSNFEIDLTKSENELLGNMKSSSCRYCIRKAIKSGVTYEEAVDLDFARDYYTQLKDVFAKQSLTPTYYLDRVQTLLKYLLPTGNLLLVRAREPHGRCIATGIFPAYNDTAYFWGGASFRDYQKLSPNEGLIWYAMQYWKGRGIKKFDFGGGGDYKRKYGGYEISVPVLIKAKYDFLIPLRNAAKRAWGLRQRIKGKFLSQESPN
jgi:CelD/BcsL family acetyltransferase involved in cellulose biosynthesis